MLIFYYFRCKNSKRFFKQHFYLLLQKISKSYCSIYLYNEKNIQNLERSGGGGIRLCCFSILRFIPR